MIDDTGDVGKVEGCCRQTGGGGECHLPEPKASRMQRCVAFVSEEEKPGAAPAAEPHRQPHSPRLVGRVEAFFFSSRHRLPAHASTLNALSVASKELLLFFFFLFPGVGKNKVKFLRRHRLRGSQTHSDCRDGASGGEEKDQRCRTLRGPSVRPTAADTAAEERGCCSKQAGIYSRCFTSQLSYRPGHVHIQEMRDYPPSRHQRTSLPPARR